MQIPHTTLRRDTEGFTLVETLVAVTILVMVIIAPLTIAQRGMQNAYFAGDQTTAVYLAQEAIEHIQGLRDGVALQNYEDYRDNIVSDRTTFQEWVDSLPASCKSTASNGGCDFDFSSSNPQPRNCQNSSTECQLRINTSGGSNGRIYQYSSGGQSMYTRRIRVGTPLTNAGIAYAVPVTATVTWNATIFGGAQRTVTLQTYVYDQYSRFSNP